MKKYLVIFLVLPVLAFASDKSQRPVRRTLVEGRIVMPSIFSDNMVLQQKSGAPFWGKGSPGKEVVIKASWGASAKTKIQDNGLWKVKLHTPSAGGPFEVDIKIGDSTIVYKNVMSGEVWLCSGQSNMEMPLEGWPQTPVENSALEIETANYPNIRLYTVARAVSEKQEFNCVGTWSECTPKTAAKFSATAYFFGRKLYKELNVPIGLIFSSWGGTKIQSWTSGDFLEKIPEYKPIVEKIKSSAPVLEKLRNWIHSHRVLDVSSKKPADEWKNLNFDDSVCSKSNFDGSQWKEMKLPTYWETTEVGEFDGAVWYRKKISIPQAWVNHALTLSLGPIDDMDETFVNDIRVGGIEQSGFYAVPRVYDIPGNIVDDITLTIAVRVVDIGGGGGLWGTPEQMKIYPKGDSTKAISLAGEWKYLPVAEYSEGKFYIYGVKGEEYYSRPKVPVDVSAATPTMLYNGMIAPVVPYSIKGVIWYQGEANVDLPSDYNNYKKLFPLMIKDWRTNWGEDSFPFYYVQIAPYTYSMSSKSQMVREAKLLTLSIPNTGMAVTLDIGSLETIHPPDKQDVGKRLALWALAKNYGKSIIYSGPLYKSMKIDGNKIVLSFTHAESGLVIKKINGETNFLISGKDSSFVKAEVEVRGNKLVVFSSQVKNPIAVRYAWSNTAEATLFNKEGLPASTFKTDDWND
jgi:sialate O-acetylesterase